MRALEDPAARPGLVNQHFRAGHSDSPEEGEMPGGSESAQYML